MSDETKCPMCGAEFTGTEHFTFGGPPIFLDAFQCGTTVEKNGEVYDFGCECFENVCAQKAELEAVVERFGCWLDHVCCHQIAISQVISAWDNAREAAEAAKGE